MDCGLYGSVLFGQVDFVGVGHNAVGGGGLDGAHRKCYALLPEVVSDVRVLLAQEGVREFVLVQKAVRKEEGGVLMRRGVFGLEAGKEHIRIFFSRVQSDYVVTCNLRMLCKARYIIKEFLIIQSGFEVDLPSAFINFNHNWTFVRIVHFNKGSWIIMVRVHKIERIWLDVPHSYIL